MYVSSRQERRGRRASALDGQPGASSCTAQHMLACRARPAPTACLELTFFSGMVHGPPIFHGSLPSPCVTATLIEDCSLLCASFLAVYAAAGWFRVASHCMRSIWCAGFSLGSPRDRPRWLLVAALNVESLIVDCLPVHASFWAGSWANGRSCFEFFLAWALPCDGSPHGAPRVRPERVQNGSRGAARRPIFDVVDGSTSPYLPLIFP